MLYKFREHFAISICVKSMERFYIETIFKLWSVNNEVSIRLGNFNRLLFEFNKFVKVQSIYCMDLGIFPCSYESCETLSVFKRFLHC